MTPAAVLEAECAERARTSHWHVEGRRDALAGRPMHPRRVEAFPSYADGYRGATAELEAATR